MNSISWIQIFSALLTPIVAIVAVFIAFMQWRTAQHKLKHELFDRRFSIYEAVRNFISSIVGSGKTRDEDIFIFLSATREAKWLLGLYPAKYLDELYSKTIDLQVLQLKLEGVPSSEEKIINAKKQAEIKKYLYSQYKILDEIFAPFLKL